MVLFKGINTEVGFIVTKGQSKSSYEAGDDILHRIVPNPH